MFRSAFRIITVVLALIVFCTCAHAQTPFDLCADNIRTDTEYLCHEIGVRVTGTPEETLTADWIESRLASMG